MLDSLTSLPLRVMTLSVLFCMFDADGGGDEFLDTAVGDAALLSFALLILRLVVVSAVWMSGITSLSAQDWV